MSKHLDLDVTMEAVVAENHARMMRMLEYMQNHTARQRFMYMNKWQITQHDDIGLKCQGVLVSTIKYEYMYVYPEGVYHCTRCEEECTMNHNTHCYYSEEYGSIVCPTCLETVGLQSRTVRAYIEGVTIKDIMPTESIELIDQRKTEEELQNRREEVKNNLKTVNTKMNTEIMYYDDKTTEMFYEEFLAKRVVRRWKNYIESRRRAQVLKVLYLAVGLDMNASIMLARNVHTAIMC